MKAHANGTDRERLAIRERLDRRLVTKSPAQDRHARRRAQVAAAARTGMVAVAVSDQRAIDSAPGIDVEVAGGAIEAIGGFSQHLALRMRFGSRRPRRS